MDQANLGERVDHRIDRGGVGLGRGLVGGIADVADSVAGGLCIITIIQSVPIVLAIGLLCGCCICPCCYF